MSRKLWFAAFGASVGAAFQHGFHIGFVNIPYEMLQTWYKNLHKERRAETKLDIVTLWSATLSSFAIGGFVGGLLIAILAGALGRKKAMLCTNGIVVLSVLMMCLARHANSYELFIVGRFMVGIHAGLNSGICPMYLIEIAPDGARGALGSLYGFFVSFALFFAQIMSLSMVLGSETLWPAGIALCLVGILLQVVTLPFCPESPKYLFIDQEDEDEAEEALIWFRDTWDIDDELDEIREETNILTEIEPVGFGRFFTDETIRTPMIISVVMMVGHHVCGAHAIFFFSFSIFEKLRFSSKGAFGLTLGLGATNMVFTLISIFLVDSLGRKSLILMSFGGMTGATLCLTIALVYIEKNPDASEFVQYAAIGFMFLLVLVFALGAATVPWLMTPEMHNHHARPVGTTIAVTVGWLMNFLASMTADLIYQDIGSFVYLFYFFGNLVTLIFLALTMRETMNESAIAIMEMFYD